MTVCLTLTVNLEGHGHVTVCSERMTVCLTLTLDLEGHGQFFLAIRRLDRPTHSDTDTQLFLITVKMNRKILCTKLIIWSSRFLEGSNEQDIFHTEYIIFSLNISSMCT